jgi:hypothetical protein
VDGAFEIDVGQFVGEGARAFLDRQGGGAGDLQRRFGDDRLRLRLGRERDFDRQDPGRDADRFGFAGDPVFPVGGVDPAAVGVAVGEFVFAGRRRGGGRPD